MLRGRDFEHVMSRAMDYGGTAMTAYNLGKAAYATGRFLLARQVAASITASSRSLMSPQQQGWQQQLPAGSRRPEGSTRRRGRT